MTLKLVSLYLLLTISAQNFKQSEDRFPGKLKRVVVVGGDGKIKGIIITLADVC